MSWKETSSKRVWEKSRLTVGKRGMTDEYVEWKEDSNEKRMAKKTTIVYNPSIHITCFKITQDLTTSWLIAQDSSRTLF